MYNERFWIKNWDPGLTDLDSKIWETNFIKTISPKSELVKAFIKLDPNDEYNGNEVYLKENIINFAKENCAPFEVPKIIEFVGELPYTLSGNVDKKILRIQKLMCFEPVLSPANINNERY